MRHRSTRTTIVLILVIALLIGATGYALATVGLFNKVQTGEGEYVGQSGTVPGITTRGVVFVNVPAGPPATASATATVLTVLVMGGAGHVSRYCAKVCTAAHFSDEFQYLVTAQAAAEGFQVTIAARSGANTVSTTVYFSVPATVAGRTTTTLDLFADLTAQSATTTGTSAMQQCSTSTHCP